MWPITGPNLAIYHSKAISGLVLFRWKIENKYLDGQDIENVTDVTPLKINTKWEILKYLFQSVNALFPCQAKQI